MHDRTDEQPSRRAASACNSCSSLVCRLLTRTVAMTKLHPISSIRCEGLLELLRLDAPSAREVVSVNALLHDARDRVREAARAKSVVVIVVGVDDLVLVQRSHVVFVVSALLDAAIDGVPSAGRVAVTAQEMEGDLVFAVYDSGRSAARPIDDVAMEAAYALGGRVWTAKPSDGNLSLFSLPLGRDQN